MVNDEDYTGAISNVIASTTSSESLKNQTTAMQQASATDQTVNPRTPAPANITQMGGYINLMLKMQKRELIQKQILQKTLESILGLKS